MRDTISNCVLFFLLALCTTLQAQEASYKTFGQGCNNRGNPPITIPTIYTRGQPVLGKSIEIGVSGGPIFSVFTSSQKLLITGFSRTSSHGWPLPLRIDPSLMNYTGNCDLFVSLDMIEVVRPVTKPIEIPPEPRLIGAKLYHQWYMWYIVTGTILDSFDIVSNAGELTIGR